METNTLTANEIADAIVSEQQRRADLEHQRAQVEQALGNGAGDPAALVVQQVTLGAQIKAAAGRILDLGQQRQSAERQEALNEYIRLQEAQRRAENAVRGLNDKITKHQEAIRELQQQREPLATEQQTALGRLMKQQQRLRALGIQGHELPG